MWKEILAGSNHTPPATSETLGSPWNFNGIQGNQRFAQEYGQFPGRVVRFSQKYFPDRCRIWVRVPMQPKKSIKVCISHDNWKFRFLQRILLRIWTDARFSRKNFSSWPILLPESPVRVRQVFWSKKVQLQPFFWRAPHVCF